MDDDTAISLLIGLILVIFIAIFAAAYSKHDRNKLITDCEKTLPRTEKCVLIAVPENTQGNNHGTYTR